MALYSNGLVPESRLIKIASGTDVNGYWEHLISAGTLRKWNAALAYAQRKWGKVMRISTGWNVYRPLRIQKDARVRAEARGEPNSAARPGWSSHGGTWVSSKHTGGRWVDALAIDVVPQQLTWAQVDEAMRAAGFLVGAITKAIAGMNEPWHYIDLDPWAAVPTNSTAKPTPAVVPEEEDDDMYKPTVHGRLTDKTEDEWTLGHPDIGTDLPVFNGTATDKNRRKDGSVTVFRGFMVTTDRDIANAWARTHAKGAGNITSSTDRAGYIAIQRELSRVAGEIG